MEMKNIFHTEYKINNRFSRWRFFSIFVTTCKEKHPTSCQFAEIFKDFTSIFENLKAKIMSELPCYTILSLPTDLEAPNEQQLKSDLEKGDTKTKIAALKKVLHLILNGDKIPGILMTIIRFVLPSQVNSHYESGP